jgi:hypothetical protein
MTRREDWTVALNDWVDVNRLRVFAWHEWDCCSAAADWVRICTGVDLFADWRDQYDDAHGAVRAITQKGGLVPLVTEMLGQPLPAAFAQRGDVVRVEIDGRESLAVCLGLTAAGPGEAAMVFVRPEHWLGAWRV